MTKKQLRADLILLLTAAIWGFAFVSQKVSLRYIGTFTFNGVRFGIGSLFLIPFILLFKAMRKSKEDPATVAASFRTARRAGPLAGVIMFIAVNMQQIALNYTSVGSASFLTGMYVVMVPLISMLFGRKISRNIWISVALAVTGIGLISITDSFSVGTGDTIVLVSTVFWAVHILYIDRFNRGGDALLFSSVQFGTCALLSLVCALIFDTITWQSLWECRWAIAYAGFLSAGIAYTLQSVGQKDALPSHAAIIMSMETVFGALGGALIGERMPVRGIFGCILMLAAIVLSQLPVRPSKETEHT